MIYAYIEAAPGNGLYTFKSWEAYREALRAERNGNRNRVKVLATASTEISGRNYQSKKAQAGNILLDFSNILSAGDLSYGELATIQEAAEKIARRAGLLREARANGIC